MSKDYYWTGAEDNHKAIKKPKLRKHVKAKQKQIDKRELGHGEYKEKPRM